MNKSLTIVIALIVGLVLGGGVGTYLGAQYEQNRNLKDVSLSHPTLPFDECETFPAEIQGNCINQVFIRQALQNNDLSLCENITTDAQKDSCRATLGYLDGFDLISKEFCLSSTNQILCSELLQVLAADIQQEAALCLAIGSSELRAFCVSRLPVNRQNTEVLQGVVINEYGPVCPNAEKSCQEQASSLKQAVLSDQLADCANTGGFLDLCVREVELYRIFVQDGEAGCESLPEIPPSRSAPRSLESSLTKEVCMVELALAADAESGRFDYLTP